MRIFDLFICIDELDYAEVLIFWISDEFLESFIQFITHIKLKKRMIYVIFSIIDYK